MSVINQMLRDLEQRRAKVPAASHYIDEINIVAKKESNYWWLLVLLLIIIIIAVNFYLHDLNQNTDNSIRENNSSHHPVKLVKSQIASVKAAQTGSDTATAAVNKQNPVTLTKQIVASLEKDTFKQPSIRTATIIKSEPRSTEMDKTDKIIVMTSIKKTTAVEKTVGKPPVKTRFNKKIAQKSSAALIQQARLLMSQDQNKAVKLLEGNVEKTTPDADYYALLANLYQRKKRFADALDVYRKALETAPDKGELWIGIALAYRGIGQMDNAASAFINALQTEDISPELKRYALQQVETNRAGMDILR